MTVCLRGYEPTDELEAAREAGLRYVTGDRPGITRRRAGKGFGYRDAFGERITSQSKIARIRAIVIPPAWTNVWICPNPRGHLRATGRDARGRKQYRYHPEWRAVRGASKFDRVLAFGEALPTLRARIEGDLRLSGVPLERVLATVISMIDQTFMRVGNEEYARTNDSYGATTLALPMRRDRPNHSLGVHRHSSKTRRSASRSTKPDGELRPAELRAGKRGAL